MARHRSNSTPQSAFLKDSKMVVRADEPDKAANAIQRLGEAKSQELSSAHCAMLATAPQTPMSCGPTESQMQMSKQVLARSNTAAQWVRDKALKQTTLAPGEQAVGAILFRKGKKPTEYKLGVPLGSETFEFPVSAQNKSPSFD